MNDFDVAQFSELMNEETSQLAMAYFSIGEITLERVHAEIVSKSSMQPEKQNLFLTR